MFTEKTLIILGAGASVFAGYPTGEKLVTQLIEKAKIKSPDFSKRLSEIHPLSIDMFLSYQREFSDIGKTLIADVILDQEAPAESTVIENKDECLYRYLVDALISSCHEPGDLLKNNDNLVIVTFNYDLSLEHYLYSRLKKISFFNEVVDEFLSDVKIYHVYGQLGYFPWHQKFVEGSYESMPHCRKNNEDYGKGFDIFERQGIAKNIQIIGTVKWSDSAPKHIGSIRSHMSEARRVYAFGFGFYEENMELIGLSNSVLHRTMNTDARTRLQFYYTNFENHQKIDNRFLKRHADWLKLANNNQRVYKSVNAVHEALAKDFDLI